MCLRQAAVAADLFWRVFMGDMSIEPTKKPLARIVAKEAKSWGKSLNGWRLHFEQVKKPAVSTMRQKNPPPSQGDKQRAEIFAEMNRVKDLRREA